MPKVEMSRRKFLEKVTYVAPTIMGLGVLSTPKKAAALSNSEMHALEDYKNRWDGISATWNDETSDWSSDDARYDIYEKYQATDDYMDDAQDALDDGSGSWDTNWDSWNDDVSDWDGDVTSGEAWWAPDDAREYPAPQ
jgi:hypothetical protein